MFEDNGGSMVLPDLHLKALELLRESDLVDAVSDIKIDDLTYLRQGSASKRHKAKNKARRKQRRLKRTGG